MKHSTLTVGRPRTETAPSVAPSSLTRVCFLVGIAALAVSLTVSVLLGKAPASTAVTTFAGEGGSQVFVTEERSVYDVIGEFFASLFFSR